MLGHQSLNAWNVLVTYFFYPPRGWVFHLYHFAWLMLTILKHKLHKLLCLNNLVLYTWECLVSSVDPSAQLTAPSLLSPLDDCSSGPAFSDGRGWISELKSKKYNLPLWSDSLTAWQKHREREWERITFHLFSSNLSLFVRIHKLNLAKRYIF